MHAGGSPDHWPSSPQVLRSLPCKVYVDLQKYCTVLPVEKLVPARKPFEGVPGFLQPELELVAVKRQKDR